MSSGREHFRFNDRCLAPWGLAADPRWRLRAVEPVRASAKPGLAQGVLTLFGARAVTFMVPMHAHSTET
jgi:hypothetical protein